MVKAVFFDKDGVLSPMIGNHGAWNMKEVLFFDGAKQAIRQIQDLGYKTFMVTNQPDPEVTDAFHFDMMQLYKTYFGFDDVISARVRNSNYYKPSTGMVDFFVETYKIDRSKSFFIGDRWRDVVCGYNAGVKTIWVKDGLFDEYECPKEYNHIKPDYEAENVYRACSLIWSLNK